MLEIPNANQALPGRPEKMLVADTHYVSGHPLKPPFPDGMETVIFGLGCFWGAEKIFWSIKGVFSTAVGYAGGLTPNPTYQEVCTGLTGHNEVVRVTYDPRIVRFGQLLCSFWESHDPTQGMKQGNDIGTQYRSGIYTYDSQQAKVSLTSRNIYQQALNRDGKNRKITTELLGAPEFFYAEDYHQQYLAKNPGGYCGIGGTGIRYPFVVSSTGNNSLNQD